MGLSLDPEHRQKPEGLEGEHWQAAHWLCHLSASCGHVAAGVAAAVPP